MAPKCGAKRGVSARMLASITEKVGQAAAEAKRRKLIETCTACLKQADDHVLDTVHSILTKQSDEC
eukprot:7787583-Lingulodinium_polyedra.AAC.1